MFGLNWSTTFKRPPDVGYDTAPSEQALTNKVTMGSEPPNNTLWGVNLN